MRHGAGAGFRCFGILAALAALALTAPVSAQTPGRTPVPLDAMVREPFLWQMQLSPDGAHLAAISSLDGATRGISIWRTDALSTNPVRFGVGGTAAQSQVQFAAIQWVSNDRLLVIFQQPVTLTGFGDAGRTYTAMARIVDLTGRRWVEPLADTGSRSDDEAFADKFLDITVIDQLPAEERHVLVEKNADEGSFVYRVNVDTGAGERVLRVGGNESVLPVVDAAGNVRVKATADFVNGEWIIRHEIFESGSWRNHPALSYTARSRRELNVVAFDPENPDILIVIDSEGANYTYARGYSISQRAFVETMFQDPNHDISNVLIERVNLAPARVIGFEYLDDTARPFYTDATYRALYERLQTQLPGRNITIGQQRGRYRIIMAQSSRHPPAYYLLTDDRQLAELGVSTPGIPSNQLAPTQLIRYQARDGLTIPAFLTLPYGWRQGVDAPLPVIIQPHGGPWGRNDSNWGGGDIPVTQYFASRGFAVLQPQFRGSTGFGHALWVAGDAEWGQKMQDDKDDGLAYLVRQGIADPNRALIYGFSYGGFAAMAATVRPNPPYRCAISGAGVSSLERLGTLWRSNRIQRQLQGHTVEGMDPLQHANDASIPILIYHGDRDQTATMWHSERFDAALGNKPHEFVVIRDMPHGALTPAMRRQEFQIVEDYIRGPCGIAY